MSCCRSWRRGARSPSSASPRRSTGLARTLYTWCAWDALIYPPILDRTAEVESTCPASGETIRLTVTPDGVESIDPSGAVLSFPDPDREALVR